MLLQYGLFDCNDNTKKWTRPKETKEHKAREHMKESDDFLGGSLRLVELTSVTNKPTHTNPPTHVSLLATGRFYL